MITAFRTLTGLIILGITLHTTVQASATSCHLHAPANYTSFSRQPLVIPAVGNESECEQLNKKRFASGGRCHCTIDAISPGRAGPSVFSQPKESPDQLP